MEEVWLGERYRVHGGAEQGQGRRGAAQTPLLVWTQCACWMRARHRYLCMMVFETSVLLSAPSRYATLDNAAVLARESISASFRALAPPFLRTPFQAMPSGTPSAAATWSAVPTSSSSSSSSITAIPSTSSHNSPLGTLLLLVSCLILLGCCSVCLVAQLRAYQRRRAHYVDEDRAPLLDPAHDPYGSPERGSKAASSRHADMASIGTPARDFVRLSSLPSSALRMDEHGRRCMACSAENECVALRPCGHAVLCRACSDFVYTCPHCGGYISGIIFKPKSEEEQASERR